MSELKLTILIDNNTLIDRYFLGEPGFCLHIRAGREILFDLGYSDAFIQNAHKLGINLRQIDAVVLSHGHLDHTWGLEPLIKLQTEALIEGLSVKQAELIAHPLVFTTKSIASLPQIGSLISRDKAAEHFELRLTREPAWLTPRLVFLGEIPRNLDFEPDYAIGDIHEPGAKPQKDFLQDDSALVYKSELGLVVIAGCAHSGICNTIERAREVCGESRVRSVIGGFHLLNPDIERLGGTIDYLKKLELESLYACHCTDLKSKIALGQSLPLREVGVGLKLEF